MPEPSSALADELSGIVGAAHVLVDPDVRSSFERDWTGRFVGSSLLVVRPGSTAEVASVLAACSRFGVAVVPQGGNTGLVGGGVPASGSGRAPVIVSTRRLDELGVVDPVAAQVTAGAGVTLARVHDAAHKAGLAFGVDFAARDSATVGGMVATNAGGVHVVRYGTMRAQVLGVEAVLADGSVVSRLSGMVKDNAGYDLSQLFVGSEGTLGVVTAARLRLVAEPSERAVVLVGVDGAAEAMDLLDLVRRRVEGLNAAELLYRNGLEMVMSHTGLPDPLPRPWPAYLLIEVATMADSSDSLLGALADAGLAEDATAVATDPRGQTNLWSYRERHTEAISAVGVPHKLDVTVPQARLGEFADAVGPAVEAAAPGSTVVLFGHAGDGNLHVNVVGPEPDDEGVDDAVLTLVASMGGSISAEHGVGRAKARWLHLVRSEAELALMRTVKVGLDPAGVLNPGVILEG